MAVTYNAVKSLLWARNLGVSFERTLTLGHLDLWCPPRGLQRAARDFGLAASREEIDRCFRRQTPGALYADELFRLLGAREFVSVDHSDYQGASHLHDLNEPFPDELRGRFDLVVDGGTLEHVFNYPAALRHCMELVRPGGHFITTDSPAHNCMGHGFYQLSPELFYRVFSARNGFAMRKIVLYESALTNSEFYEVKDPAVTGQRTELNTPRPMLLSVLAQRVAQVPVLAVPPQESDYAATWQDSQRSSPPRAVAHSGLAWRLRVAMRRFMPSWLRRWRNLLAYRRAHGRPTLGNHRHFRRLSHDEICRERARPADVSLTP